MYLIDRYNDIIAKSQDLYIFHPILITLIASYMRKLSRAKEFFSMAQNTERSVQEAVKCLSSAVIEVLLQSLESGR